MGKTLIIKISSLLPSFSSGLSENMMFNFSLKEEKASAESRK